MAAFRPITYNCTVYDEIGFKADIKRFEGFMKYQYLANQIAACVNVHELDAVANSIAYTFKSIEKKGKNHPDYTELQRLGRAKRIELSEKKAA